MIHIIGIGIEGRASLSQMALKLIDNANLLIGGKRHLASFPEFQGEKVVIGSNLGEVVKAIRKKSEVRSQKSGERIVILATGDPNFFGIANFIIKKFGKKSVEIIPNVSTMQEAFARIKENWNDARFVSAHGRNKGQTQDARCRMQDANGIEWIVDEIICCDKVGIFTDPENTPSKIAKALLDKGIKEYKGYVCEDLGTEKEKITTGDLKQIVNKRFSPLNVMLLIRHGQGARGIRISDSKSHTPHPTPHIQFGIPDSAFSHSKGMITKEEIRVISLSKLKLKNDSIIWDIGSGSGSLSIEAAMFANQGKVFALEKDAVRVKQIERNKKKFNTANLEIIHKNVPDGLKNLAAPDTVFIGGGGKDVAKILDVCSKRLRQGGRIIVNAITLETLSAATGFFKSKGWNAETISVNIAKTKLVPASLKQGDVANLHLFNAYNPVFIVVGEKK